MDKTPQIKYKKNSIKQIKFELNKNTDADLINKMETVSNKQGYLKVLVKSDEIIIKDFVKK